MKRSILLSAVAAASALLLSSNSGALACVDCTSAQNCQTGNDGSSCRVWIDDDGQWCNQTLDCKSAMNMTPLDVTTAGTLLAAEAQPPSGDGLLRSCQGFVVGRNSEADDGADVSSLSI